VFAAGWISTGMWSVVSELRRPLTSPWMTTRSGPYFAIASTFGV
jgi:hypothetical protein